MAVLDFSWRIVIVSDPCNSQPPPPRVLKETIKACITVFIHALSFAAETAGGNEDFSPIRSLRDCCLTPSENLLSP